MTKQEDKLREIVYRNWKNGDEVGLYEEVKKLHLQELEKIREMIKGMKGHRAGCLNEEYPDDCDCGQFATEMARDDFTSNNR